MWPRSRSRRTAARPFVHSKVAQAVEQVVAWRSRATTATGRRPGRIRAGRRGARRRCRGWDALVPRKNVSARSRRDPAGGQADVPTGSGRSLPARFGPTVPGGAARWMYCRTVAEPPGRPRSAARPAVARTRVPLTRTRRRVAKSIATRPTGWSAGRSVSGSPGGGVPWMRRVVPSASKKPAGPRIGEIQSRPARSRPVTTTKSRPARKLLKRPSRSAGASMPASRAACRSTPARCWTVSSPSWKPPELIVLPASDRRPRPPCLRW